MPIVLKPHNIETYKKMQDRFKDNKRVAIIQPPGTGKSYLALKFLEENKGKKAIYLAPSNPILHNLKKSIFESGMSMRDFSKLKRITYAKLMRMSDEEISEIGADIIILDEFHHCGAPEWGNGVNRLLQQNPNARILGLSATPIRYLDQGRDMAEELFNGNVASEMTLEEAIDKGILPEATYVSALYSYGDQLNQIQQNIAKISDTSKRAEAQRLFIELKGRLDENTQHLPELLSQYMTNKSGKYIVFCKNIDDMKQKMQVAQEMFGNVNPNITTYSISSRDDDVRLNDKTLTTFEQDDDDKLKLMFAVNMLNEGYHIRDLDGVVMMRPTFSPTIFEQQLGRALSVKSNEGTPPVILDLVNNFDSCKIIEDFYERMKQAGTGDGQRGKNEKRGRLAIFDKTKEFREIASKITALCQRKVVTIDEKIEIFNRFLETGEDLTGKTIFEGHPIGQWGIQIRSALKNQTMNLTEEQVDKLNSMGILDRQIDTTIDEKIQELIDWLAKYPKAKVQFTNVPIDILREYAQSDEELEKLKEQYERMQKHYDYVRARSSRRKINFFTRKCM